MTPRARLTTLLAALVSFAVAFAIAWVWTPRARPRAAAAAEAPTGSRSPDRPAAGPRMRAARPAPGTDVVRGPYAVELFEALDHDGTGRGARVREALSRAMEKMYVELLALRGRTASACAPDVIDETVIRIRYAARSTDTELTLEHGAPPEGDFEPEVHRCLEDYLRHRVVVTAEEIGAPLAALDADVIGLLPTGDVRPAAR